MTIFVIIYVAALFVLVPKACVNEELQPVEYLPYFQGKKCFGYEKNCDFESSFSGEIMRCSSEGDIETYFKEVDFGYVKRFKDSLIEICEPRSKREGSLLCSEQLQFCKAKDIWIDFRDLFNRRNENLRYSSDILKPGQIKAKCQFDESKLKKEMLHMGVLQSWSSEFKNFETFEKNEVMPCDIRIEKPTIIMKLDATVNLYHHFCDFFNLYASLHINGSTE